MKFFSFGKSEVKSKVSKRDVRFALAIEIKFVQIKICVNPHIVV